MSNSENDLAAPETGRGRAFASRAGALAKNFNLLGLIIALIVLYVYFTFKLHGTFLTRFNLETIARQTAIVGIASLGVTLIIICGGIDLSIGSGVALVTVVIALALQHHSPLIALLYGVLVGAGVGLFNGFIITKLKVGPFIVTLGSLLMFRGLARGLAHDNTVSVPSTWMGDLLTVPAPNDPKFFPIGVWLMLILTVLVGLLLHRTVFGRNVVAVGSNEAASRISGVNVERVKIAVYILGGLFVGLAGLMQFSYVNCGDPTGAAGRELDVIAAAVIGGASLAGGQGSILGSLLGAIFMTTLANGFTQMGVDEWVKQIVTGGIIVLAVALDRFRSKTIV